MQLLIPDSQKEFRGEKTGHPYSILPEPAGKGGAVQNGWGGDLLS